jgi:hypothetical protein
MGRFDALTQLDKKPLKPTPPPVISASAAADPQTPSPLLENEVVSLLAKKQTDKEASRQTSLHANLQAGKDASIQTGKPANLHAGKQVNLQTGKQVIIEKYSSYLTHEYKRELKRIAFESDRNEYEVLIEAVELYLTRQKQPK